MTPRRGDWSGLLLSSNFRSRARQPQMRTEVHAGPQRQKSSDYNHAMKGFLCQAAEFHVCAMYIEHAVLLCKSDRSRDMRGRLTIFLSLFLSNSVELRFATSDR